MSKLRFFLFCFLSVCTNSIPYVAKNIAPKLTIIIVVDQFADSYLQKINFVYGINRMQNYGINFVNAHFRNAKPETATGHAALNTGACAEYSGFVGNNWFDQLLGKKVNCDFDDNDAIFVFDNPKTYGKSARNLMVDGISDRFVARSTTAEPYCVFSLSLKSRAAIAMAGHVREPYGAPFWFESGGYTTSNAFCSKIPSWVKKHNKQKNVYAMKEIFWKSFYEPRCDKYNMVNQNTYQFSQEEQFFNQTKKMDAPGHKEDSFFWYQASPQAMYDLFDLAKTCIRHNLKENGHMVLWISMSGLDKLGHVFGPDSYETIDYLYHFDYALENFLRFVKNEVGKRHFICILTADHGTSELPELSEQRGLPSKRISTTDLKKNINTHVEQKHGVQNIIAHCNVPEIYIDKAIFNKLNKEQQKQVLQTIYTFLKQHEGMQWVWKTEILLYKDPEKDSFEANYKKQIYPGRSGDFIVQPSPFYTFTNYKRGSNHSVPYAPDTHVPIIFYGPKYFSKKKVFDKVSPLQLAVTLALFLGVEIPSAAVKDPLPYIFSRDPLFDAF